MGERPWVPPALTTPEQDAELDARFREARDWMAENPIAAKRYGLYVARTMERWRLQVTQAFDDARRRVERIPS